MRTTIDGGFLRVHVCGTDDTRWGLVDAYAGVDTWSAGPRGTDRGVPTAAADTRATDVCCRVHDAGARQDVGDAV